MLDVSAISIRFGEVTALDGVNLTVKDRSVVSLMGPSGSGKSTLLRVIAGLEQPGEGDVTWDGSSVLDIPTHRRGFGMMFQDYALFPHRTVAQNVSFGLRMQRLPADEIAMRSEGALDLVGLTGYGPRSVATLSGGEQQRVALARTLSPEPVLVLLDEPLGALDRALRERLVEDMRDIFGSIGVTALYVTHDRDEAFAIADKVAVIDGGRIIAEGTPEELWRRSPTDRIGELIGLKNRLKGAVEVSTSEPTKGTVRRSSFRSGRYQVEVDLDAGSSLVGVSDRRLEPGTRVGITSDSSPLRTED